MKTSPESAYNQLASLLVLVEAPHGEAYRNFHAEQRAVFLDMPASAGGHHAWIGGYAVHIAEVVSNITWLLNSDRFPGSTRPKLSDAVIAAYIHDLDKLLMRYERDTEKPTDAQLHHFHVKSRTIKLFPDETKSTLSKKIDAAVKGSPQPERDDLPWHKYREDARNMDDSAAVLFLCQRHGLGGITEDICHAISLHHGGWAPLAIANTKVRLSPLASLLHASDLLSSHAQQGETN